MTFATLNQERHGTRPEFPQRSALGAFAPWLGPHDPLVGDLQNAYLVGPGGRFLPGADTQGRGVLSRVLFGARLDPRLGSVG